MEKNAKAVYDSNNDTITMQIEGTPTILKIDDCIEVERNIVGNEKIEKTIAKITRFQWNWSSEYASGIYYLPWRSKENRWSADISSKRKIPLDYIDESIKWTSIRKLDKCPIVPESNK
jgi:hypothetical protein